MKFVKPILTAMLCAAPVPAVAASLFVNTNFSQSTDPGSIYSYTTPTYPHRFIGVNFEAGYNAIEATASFNGRARFDFPTFTPGQIITYLPSGLWSLGPIGYSHSFSESQLTGGVNFFAKANYHLGYGPFSVDGTLASANVAPTIDASMAGNSPIGFSSAEQSAAATANGLGIAYVAGASTPFGNVEYGRAELSITPGIRASNTLNWNGDFTYGYYYWTNTTGDLTDTDAVRWVSTGSGSPLDLYVRSLESGLGYLNVLPGIRMNAELTQTQQLDFTLSGHLLLRWLGSNLVDWNAPTSAFTLAKDGQGFSVNEQEWVSRRHWSLRTICVADTVCLAVGDALIDQARLGDKLGEITPLAETIGGFRRLPGLTDEPPAPPACLRGVCYAVDDPNLPIDFFDPVTSGAVPEPANWAMMIIGFGLVGGAMRRRAQIQATVSA